MKLRQRKKNIRKFLAEKKKHFMGKGVQYIYRFPNGSVVSVIKFEVSERGFRFGSYGADVGLYELACKDEVLGYLTRNDVIRHLERIKRERLK